MRIALCIAILIGLGYKDLHHVTFCPMAFCPVTFCLMTFCPVALCPETSRIGAYSSKEVLVEGSIFDGTALLSYFSITGVFHH